MPAIFRHPPNLGLVGSCERLLASVASRRFSVSEILFDTSQKWPVNSIFWSRYERISYMAFSGLKSSSELQFSSLGAKIPFFTDWSQSQIMISIVDVSRRQAESTIAILISILSEIQGNMVSEILLL